MCREKALAIYLFDTFSSAANMRSDHTEAFVHSLSRPWTSAPCLTLTGTSDAPLCSCRAPHATTFLSPFPRCGFALRTSHDFRRFGTMQTLTPAQLTYRAGLPAYCATPLLSFRLQPRGLPGHRFPHHASVTSEFRTSPCMSRLVAAPRRIEFVLLRTNSSP